MNNQIGPTVKHVRNDAMHLLNNFLGFVMNTRAYHYGQYSPHLILLKSSMFGPNEYFNTHQQLYNLYRRQNRRSRCQRPNRPPRAPGRLLAFEAEFRGSSGGSWTRRSGSATSARSESRRPHPRPLPALMMTQPVLKNVL